MGQLSRALLIAFVMILAMVRPLVAQDVLERTSRDHLFQVIGVDFNGTQTVGAIADQLERLGLRYFPESRNFPAPIRVTLLVEPTFDVPYVVSLQPNGNYIVYIAWNEDTTFSDVCQSLASAFIRRTAIWRYGPSAGPQTPHWLELAFGQLLEAAIRPGYADVQRERALMRPTLGLNELLTARGPFDLDQEKVALNAVWFFRLLENRIPDRQLFRHVLAAFLKDLDPSYVMVKAFPGQFADQDALEMWWAVGFQAMARSRETPFFTMEQSRELVRSMAIVTVSIDGKDRRMAGPSLWEYREHVNVQSAIIQRQREVKLELQRVNPVYYNSLLSLGLFFEAAMTADVAKPMLDANDLFLADYRNAQEMELEIKRLLRW